ncbi:hypothetical protein LZ017_07070 [Pelomonas sp. CA6]|uniref:hypothetical protein n=1 Tax=Pelomonas sp. CA6 TaxID=2907999 RepID=UPI001F4C09C1|nr:hypothetical protein [Pelomonas sp. CA6]MCH7343138.1 hypothetical protein [Pelomonas sp. CA6]
METIQHLARVLALVPMVTMGSARADWVPQVQNRFYTATVTVNGGSSAITEPRSIYGPLHTLAGEAIGAPLLIKNGIDSALRPKVELNGAQFLSSRISGDLNITLTPTPAGVIRIEVMGPSYSAVSSFQGKMGGIIRYDCQNVLTFNNIRVIGQAGTAGPILPGTVALELNPTSSTACDSNLSWLLPIVGELLVDKISGKLDTQLEEAVVNFSKNIRSSLFVVAEGNNFRSGLQQLVPQSSVVRLPNGQEFRIGDFIWNNFDYITRNSQMTIKLSKGAPVDVVRGMQNPYDSVVTGTPLKIDVNVPGMLTFSVELKETAWVEWQWVCNVTRPSEACAEP